MIPLVSDTVTVALVELYAQRRGLSRNEALRRLVRTALGVDPVGEWEDKRRRRLGDPVLCAAARKIRPPRTAKGVPAGYEQMFGELKSKVGLTEARRMVIEHAAIDRRRSTNAAPAI